MEKKQIAKKSLTKEEVEHIARLAKLTLTSKEVERFREQLSEILGYIEILNELENRKGNNKDQKHDLVNVTREDRAETSLDQKDVLSQTKEKSENMFKVKAIFE